MEEELLLLMLLFEEEENEEMRVRRCEVRHLRDSSDPFTLPENEFTKNFRLTRRLSHKLIEDLQPHDIQNTSLPLTIRVLATLNFFGHGSYQKYVGNNCNLPMSQSSISRAIRSVAQLIVKVKGAEIRFPMTIEEKNATKTGFFGQFGIKNTIGAIDCTHIAIVAPSSNDVHSPLNLYVNRRGFYSINVEAVCDHRLLFTFLNTKFPGAIHDSDIWDTSDIREHLIRFYNDMSTFEQESWLIGDQGYPQEPWLLTPIANPSTRQEIKFNKLHANSRNCIKKAFGLLKMRFRCLLKHRTLHYSHETAGDIIASCVILHNILLKSGAPEINPDEVVGSDYVVTAVNPSEYTHEGENTRRRYVSSL